MTELLTAAQMRAIEQAAIASGEVTGLELMERAGRGVVEAVFEEWPEMAITSHRAVVLCGPGNNGGDGFVVARLLKEWGWEVEVFLYGEVGKLPPDARVNCDRWLEMATLKSLNDFDSESYRIVREDDAGKMIFIDAIFGTGLSRPLNGKINECAVSLSNMPLGPRSLVLSIDLPTGICSDSGRALGAAFPSELCVTFHTAKIGHYIGDINSYWERPIVKDIGLPMRYPNPLDSCALACFDAIVLPSLLDKATDAYFSQADNKFHHGHALILSGPATKTGAARLAARGALRIGAGLV
ncbi:MAG: NAD(P)H-hydrate epimerase, partial [Rhodobacteraceae bacterium]|nr:NAD(P)H-hydrate epimerase [Paracoccaceae bacterium]